MGDHHHLISTSALDRHIERAEHRLKFMRDFRAMIAEDPELAEELLAILQAQVGDSGKTHGGHASDTKTHANRPPTYYEQLVDFFRAHNNTWLTVQEIADAAELPRTGVANVIYKSHPDAFEKKQHPEHGRKQLWRLKEAGTERQAEKPLNTEKGGNHHAPSDRASLLTLPSDEGDNSQ